MFIEEVVIMRKMGKKILMLVILISLGFYGMYYMTYPQYYYVKITVDGKLEAGSNEIYVYTLKGYNEKGEEKNLEFSTHPDLKRPFKKNAYLKVKYTNWKKENGYVEVKKAEVPNKALYRLELTK